MNQTIITLKKGEGRLLKSGGLWIFDNEIADVKGDFENGDMVSVQDFDGYPMGQGFINVNSKIRVRMLTRNPQTLIDDEFFFQVSIQINHMHKSCYFLQILFVIQHQFHIINQ